MFCSFNESLAHTQPGPCSMSTVLMKTDYGTTESFHHVQCTWANENVCVLGGRLCVSYDYQVMRMTQIFTNGFWEMTRTLETCFIYVHISSLLHSFIHSTSAMPVQNRALHTRTQTHTQAGLPLPDWIGSSVLPRLGDTLLCRGMRRGNMEDRGK